MKARRIAWSIVGLLSLSAAVRAQAECRIADNCVELWGSTCEYGYPDPSPAICGEDPCKGCSCPCGRGLYNVQFCIDPDGVHCTDGDPCTTNDTCHEGSCVGQAACLMGDPPPQCYALYCNQVSPCAQDNFPPGTPCDDGNFCNGPDRCSGGSCVPTGDPPCPGGFCQQTCDESLDQCVPPLPCDDNDACTRDWCDPTTGCRHEALDCDDENACNGTEGCDTQSGCRQGEPLDCDDENACTDDWCEAASGCHYSYNSRSCDDDDACTTNDTCSGGTCGGTTMSCDDGNACTTDSCDESTGCQHVQKDCDDHIACTLDRCDPLTGDCLHDCVPQGAPSPKGIVPEADDRTFVKENDVQLASGTYTFDIRVTRYAGPTDGSGHLTDVAALIADGLAGEYANLEILAWGVLPGTRHQVCFNEDPNDCRVLQPSYDCTWSRTSFSVQLAHVKFPGARGSFPYSPDARINSVKITVDGQPVCLRFRSASLSVKLMSPIILIHGTNNNGNFFIRQGFADHNFAGSLPNQHLLFDSSINMTTASRQANGVILGSRIYQIMVTFGVDSAHLVAHSKGGLDAREFLQFHYPSKRCVLGITSGAACESNSECGTGEVCKRFMSILSLTTLDTPHNGTVLADIPAKLQKVSARAAVADFSFFPFMIEELFRLNALFESLFREDQGRASLTTDACAAFNSYNPDKLPKDTIYNTVSADADCSGNGEIDALRFAEWTALNTEDPRFGWPSAANVGYRLLRKSREIRLDFQDQPMTLGGSPPRTVGFIDLVTGGPYDNDVLVTAGSAQGVGSFQKGLRPDDEGIFLAGEVDCRNHASVANARTAARVGPWIVSVEREYGDLR